MVMQFNYKVLHFYITRQMYINNNNSNKKNINNPHLLPLPVSNIATGVYCALQRALVYTCRLLLNVSVRY